MVHRLVYEGMPIMSNTVPESKFLASSASQKKMPTSWREHTDNSSQEVLKLLYSRKEAAFALGISLRALDYLVSRRSIKVRRVGARVLIHRDDLVKWASHDHLNSVAA